MTQDQAQTYALTALTWLVGQEDILGVFLGASGASAQDLRERASDLQFHGAVLDFILMDDAWVIACCEAMDLDPSLMKPARMVLPGGQDVNWT